MSSGEVMPAQHVVKVDFVSLSREYAGKWVALDPESGQVLVAAATPEEVVRMVEEKGIEDPLIMNVSDDYGSYVSCILG